jgi:predicted esterase
MRKIFTTVCYTILFLFIVSAGISATTYLDKFHVLTARQVDHLTQPPVTLEQLIRTIHATNTVPLQTTLKINNKYYAFHRGIQVTREDTTIFIFSRGYAKTNKPGTNDNFIQWGAGATAAYIHLRDHIVTQGPLVSFDYDDSRTGFSFGQTNAITVLESIYNEVIAKNPQAPIVLIGDCHGGKVALELALRNPKNLKALILLSPFISARDITYRIADHYLSPLPFSRHILHTFFKLYFTKYDESKDDLEQRLKNIPPQLPIFIAHREPDTLVGLATIKKLERLLKARGNHAITVIIVNDTTYPHSMLTSNRTVQAAIQTFLKEQGML